LSVDFTDVKAGDRIKLTRKNGDEITFTVADVRGRTAEDSYKAVYYPNEWDTLEVLVPPLPTGEHALVGHPTDKEKWPFLLIEGKWYRPGARTTSLPGAVSWYMANEGYEVLYEGVKQEAENE